MRQLLTAATRDFRGLSAMRQKAPELRSLNAARGIGAIRCPQAAGPYSIARTQHFPRHRATGCALHDALLFFARAKKSKQKKARPDIRVWRLRRQTSLLPVPLRGPAYKGRPWPFKPFAASLRLVPLRNTSTRPSDGDSGSALFDGSSCRFADFWWMHFRRVGSPQAVHHTGAVYCPLGEHTLPAHPESSGNSKRPFRRVSGIVA
jgi:hypothetical protein